MEKMKILTNLLQVIEMMLFFISGFCFRLDKMFSIIIFICGLLVALLVGELMIDSKKLKGG